MALTHAKLVDTLRTFNRMEPLVPKLVVAVRYDHIYGDRFRHGTELVRCRPHKAPRQCTFEQLQIPVRPAKLIRRIVQAEHANAGI